ncbi:MAG TPA: hypothetical protein DCE41_14980 [Cytophagales bacterium]|nr:hypothetical protein [Cytophagales bacterium]HAA24046.1 hypothetical protein [Cytophagales bacterium]HAP64697.1 hypothetical protein [Cytophagales bacterium]
MDTQAGGVIALDAPRPKLNISHIGIFAFSIFWLGFVAVWTTMTIVMNAGFMPLFSIPFWVVGIYMLVRNFRSIATRQQLVISGHELSLIKIRPGGRKTWAYPLNEVRGAEIQEDVNYTSRRTGSTHRTVHVTKNPYLIIQSGNKKFFESQSQGDKEWIVGFINQFLKTKRG